jgi:hypothetical protein
MRLAKLVELRNGGVLTEAEFADQKARLPVLIPAAPLQGRLYDDPGLTRTGV